MIELSKKIVEIIDYSRNRIAGYANTTMVIAYFEIGKILVEQWQEGEKRADYGSKLLQQVSADLKDKLGKGFSVQNLERMRAFYLVYSKSPKELRISEDGLSNIYFDLHSKNKNYDLFSEISLFYSMAAGNLAFLHHFFLLHPHPILLDNVYQII